MSPLSSRASAVCTHVLLARGRGRDAAATFSRVRGVLVYPRRARATSSSFADRGGAVVVVAAAASLLLSTPGVRARRRRRLRMEVVVW